jgi:hypothetical protein
MTGSFRVRLWRRKALTRDLGGIDHLVECDSTTTIRSRAGHSILSNEIHMGDLPNAFLSILKGATRGRTVVNLA